jgi:pimeloyl-ACP methyl ester carboxylesterase
MELDTALLPGLDGTGILFRPLLAALPGDIRPSVITYPADRVLSLPEHARSALRQLPAGRSVLVAESFSGLVALAMLMEAPSRIGGIVFAGAFAEPPRPLLTKFAPAISRFGTAIRSAPSFLLRRFCLGADATAEQLDLLREALAAVSPSVMAHRLALAGKRHNFKGPFAVPCCYLQASHDRLVPAGAASWFGERFASFRLEIVQGPHFLLQTRPRECAQLIARMIRAHDA